MANLSFRETSAMGNRKQKSGRLLTEKLAENFERVKSFPIRVEAGDDHPTGQAHELRLERGYLGNMQELWLQARGMWGVVGIPQHYETVTVGLNGYISTRVWHEAHAPLSKALSLRIV